MANFVLGEYEKEGVPPAWDIKYCPTVTVGPDSPVGHLSPSDEYVAKAGDLIHMDQGVILNEYISDIQRVWYLQPKGETSIPQAVQHAFNSVRAAIMAAAAVLKPGVQGYVVDDAARQTIIKAGYPEYKHATGHQIGRTVHDGSVLLGPRWERYGKTPLRYCRGWQLLHFGAGCACARSWLHRVGRRCAGDREWCGVVG